MNSNNIVWVKGSSEGRYQLPFSIDTSRLKCSVLKGNLFKRKPFCTDVSEIDLLTSQLSWRNDSSTPIFTHRIWLGPNNSETLHFLLLQIEKLSVGFIPQGHLLQFIPPFSKFLFLHK